MQPRSGWYDKNIDKKKCAKPTCPRVQYCYYRWRIVDPEMIEDGVSEKTIDGPREVFRDRQLVVRMRERALQSGAGWQTRRCARDGQKRRERAAPCARIGGNVSTVCAASRPGRDRSMDAWRETTSYRVVQLLLDVRLPLT